MKPTRCAVVLCTSQNKPSALEASSTWQTTTTYRRSKRSATWPVANENRIAGANCARPTYPRLIALPVSA